MDNLNISVITAVSQISSNINLNEVYEKTPIDNYVTFIEYGLDKPVKGYSEKLNKKKRKNKVKKTFYNQLTLHVNQGKIINVKLFNNGKIQLTGLKYMEQGEELLNKLINYFIELEILNKGSKIIKYRIVMVNSDFDLCEVVDGIDHNYEINREELHRSVSNIGLYSSFEPCIYPGVNMKYFINTNTNDGLCKCNSVCDGKGLANGDGDCKKITIAVFKSGKTIITGGQNKEQILKAKNFIIDFTNNNRSVFKLKENKDLNI